MIQYVNGNIFSSSAQTLVNPVNTVGVMGKGLALAFKLKYPEMFEQYRTACLEHQLTTGKLMIWHGTGHWVLSFPTKEHWRNPSKMEYIESGLEKFVSTYKKKGITSVAFPLLGCGVGGLQWANVKPLMEKYLNDIDIPVYIYIK